MKRKQRKQQKAETTSGRPEAVNEIARSLLLSSLFFLFLGGIFALGLGAYYFARPSDLATTGCFLAISVIALAVGTFLLSLAMGFKRLKPWTYGWVHEMAVFVRMPFHIKLSKVEASDVRRAFGLEPLDESPKDG